MRSARGPSNLESLCSPYCGIVNKVDEVLSQPELPNLVSISSAEASTIPTLGRSVNIRAGGIGHSRASARAAALGEAVERYSAVFVPYENLQYSNRTELGEKAWDPARCQLYSTEQLEDPDFPFCNLDSHSKFSWTLGTSLVDGELTYAPAQFVYLGYTLREEEPYLGIPTSSGLACGQTREQAVLAGLLEIIERDAFMIAWMSRLSLPRVDWSHFPEFKRLHEKYLRPAKPEISLVDLSSLAVLPVVLAIARDPQQAEVPLAVGAAAAPTLERACWKAAEEAVQTYSWALSYVYHPDNYNHIGDRHTVRNFNDHIAYYLEESRARSADFLDASVETVGSEQATNLPYHATSEEYVNLVVDMLYSRGITTYAFNVTSPDIEQADLHVVRVLSPELCWLDVSYEARYLGQPRLSTAAYEVGHVNRPLYVKDFNTEPHPFP